ncbi:L-lactate dehydrogenase [Ureibacillus acetophenoni]
MTQNIDLKCFPYSYEELERLAAENTSPEAFDYVQSGSSTEQTLRTNVQAFSSYAFKPRVCTGTKAVDSKIEIFGKEYPFPIFFAPVGNQKVVHPEGELASARAAKRLNVPYIASTVSSHTIEEIAEASGNGDRWFQLYATKDQDVTNSLISRAEKNGYTAIVLTVDMAPSWRVKDMRNQFLPAEMVKELLTEEELNDLFNYETYLGLAPVKVDEVLASYYNSPYAKEEGK